MNPDTPDRLFWLDIETTGVDPALYDLLEVAAYVTDTALEPIDEFECVVRPWDDTLPGMPDVVRGMHTASGLLAELASGLPDPDAEEEFSAFVAEYGDGAYLAGSGVHFDRAFLNHHWPGALRPLHYRNFDVSTLRTFTKLYFPPSVYEQRNTHRAMADVQDAIAELRHYRDNLSLPMTLEHTAHADRA